MEEKIDTIEIYRKFNQATVVKNATVQNATSEFFSVVQKLCQIKLSTYEVNHGK